MLQPIRNTIAVKPCLSDDKTEGGIFIPENIRERSSKAKIVAVGGGTKDKPMKLPIGVTCFHIKGAGDEFIHEGESYFLMQQQDVLAYIEN